MDGRLKLFVISLLIGIAGTLMVTASQWNPSSEVRADTTDGFHVRRLHLAEDELHLNKTLKFFLEQYSALTVFIDELPLYNILIGITLVSLALLLYRPLFAPRWVIKNLGDAGYITDGRIKREVVEEIRKRSVGNVPPVYPNGWFSLARSWELKQGETKYVQALGHDFAIYRGEDGKAYAIEAFCPHRGTNLGVGGKVKGDCIQCPFDGWTFRGSDGKCIDLGNHGNIDKKVPDETNTRAWACVEVNNEIYIWHHAEGEQPDWFIPEIEGVKTGKLKFHGYSEHYVNTHIEDISENGVEDTHLDYLHAPVLAGNDIRYLHSWVSRWVTAESVETSWCEDNDEKHKGVATVDIDVCIFGYHIMPAGKIIHSQVGPSTIHSRTHFSLTGGMSLIIQQVLPVEPLVLKVTNCIYSTPSVPRPMAKWYLWLVDFQSVRDFMFYNYKTYQSKPALEEDSAVNQHRRWYSQFYSENSPRFHSLHGRC